MKTKIALTIVLTVLLASCVPAGKEAENDNAVADFGNSVEIALCGQATCINGEQIIDYVANNSDLICTGSKFSLNGYKPCERKCGEKYHETGVTSTTVAGLSTGCVCSKTHIWNKYLKKCRFGPGGMFIFN